MSLENVAAPAAEPAAPQAQATELQPQANAPAADGVAPQEGAPAEPQQQQQPEGESPEQAERKRERFDRRFSDLSKAARKAEQEAAYWRGRFDAVSTGQQPSQTQPAQPAAPAGPPNPQDYPQGQFDPNYVKDLAKHEVREDLRREADARAQAERKAAEDAAYEAGAQRFVQTVEAAEDLADGPQGQYFARAPEVLREAARTLPPALVDLITESENPIHVAELIGRGGMDGAPVTLRDLKGMSQVQAARTIARLDTAISLALKQRETQATQTPAARPAPTPQPAAIPTAPAAGSPVSFDPNKGSMDDYVRWRNGGA